MSATVFLGTPSLRSPPRKRGPSPFRQRVWPWVPACAGTNGDGNGNGLRDGSSDRQKFFPPLPADRLAAEQRELVERPGDRLAGRLDRGHRVAMGAADRLGDDLIDDAEADEVLRGDLHRGRRLLR